MHSRVGCPAFTTVSDTWKYILLKGLQQSQAPSLWSNTLTGKGGVPSRFFPPPLYGQKGSPLEMLTLTEPEDLKNKEKR